MELKDISIATISWARNREEEMELRTSLEALSELKIPVFITDGGSGPSFVDFLRRLSHFTVAPAEGKGLWAQVKASLLEGLRAGSRFIFYTEPDKLDFFRKFLPQMIRDISVTEKTGIVLASRSPEGFATFPLFQQMTETTINNCCAEIIGKTLDYTYGPFLMKNTVAAHLQKVEEDTGWGWRPLAFGLAQRLGYDVQAYTGPFFCPPEQRHDDKAERLYRMKQLSQNMQGIVLSQSFAL